VAGLNDLYVKNQSQSISLSNLVANNPGVVSMVKLITMQPSLSNAQVQSILQYVLSLSPSRPIATS
jgi:hypothetical protein